MGLRNWILAARLKTLGAAYIPVISATALASAMGVQWRGWILFTALTASLLIQVATNLFNDAIDFKKGADTPSRLGPTRVTASGLIEQALVYRVAFVCCVLAALISVPLILKGGLPILTLGGVSLFLAYGYTGGPFPLAYLGLGDLFVFLFFGLAAVLGTFFLHSGLLPLPWESVVLGSQIGLWASVLIAVNNFRDAEEDRKNYKMTLAATFGNTFSRIEITLLLLIPYALGAYFWNSHSCRAAALLPLLSLPLSFWIIYRVWKWAPSRRFNILLAQAGAVHILSGLLLSAGFLLR